MRDDAAFWKHAADFWLKEAFRLAERDGWVAFGHHIGHGDHSMPEGVELEFDGDEDGLPLWERPIKEGE